MSFVAGLLLRWQRSGVVQFVVRDLDIQLLSRHGGPAVLPLARQLERRRQPSWHKAYQAERFQPVNRGAYPSYPVYRRR